MTANTLVYKNSPFIPNNEKELILQVALGCLEMGLDLSTSLSMAILPTMELHTRFVTNKTLVRHNLTSSHLAILIAGFKLPLESILTASTFQNLNKEEYTDAYEATLTPTEDYFTLLYQEVIRENLVSLVNLYKINPRSELIFEHLQKYSTISHEIFKAGSEIAAIVYFNLAPDFANMAGDNNWLTDSPYIPDNLI